MIKTLKKKLLVFLALIAALFAALGVALFSAQNSQTAEAVTYRIFVYDSDGNSQYTGFSSSTGNLNGTYYFPTSETTVDSTSYGGVSITTASVYEGDTITVAFTDDTGNSEAYPRYRTYYICYTTENSSGTSESGVYGALKANSTTNTAPVKFTIPYNYKTLTFTARDRSGTHPENSSFGGDWLYILNLKINERTTKVSIDGKSTTLNDYAKSAAGKTYTYTGSAISPFSALSSYCTISDGSATNVGTYTATLTPKKGYKWKDETESQAQYEARKFTWKITEADISPTLTMSDFIYGAGGTPKISGNSGNGEVTYYYSKENSTSGGTVWDGGKTLGVGTYYMYASVAKSTNYNAATTAKAVEFTVSQKTLDGNAVENIAAVSYTGAKQEPALTIKDGDKTLVAGTDYDVEYEDNTNAGTATANITYKGNYTGAATKKFEIKKADQSFEVGGDSSLAVLSGKGAITVSGSGATYLSSGYTYTSSNSNVVTVDKDGNLTAGNKVGTATITVTNPGNNNLNETTTTFTVTTTLENGFYIGDLSGDNTVYATLQEAVNAAAKTGSATTIHIKGNPTVAEKTTIPSRADITIVGDSGATLTRKSGYTGAMIDVESGAALTLKDITLDGESVSGEALITSAGTIKANSGTVIQNAVTDGNGGAIEMSGGELVVNGATFQNNTAANGGAVYVGGKAKITVTDGTFTGNKATEDGGAIWISGKSTGSAINGGTFSSNSATENGSNVYIDSTASDEGTASEPFVDLSGYTGEGVALKLSGSTKSALKAKATDKSTLENVTVLGSSESTNGLSGAFGYIEPIDKDDTSKGYGLYSGSYNLKVKQTKPGQIEISGTVDSAAESISVTVGGTEYTLTKSNGIGDNGKVSYVLDLSGNSLMDTQYDATITIDYANGGTYTPKNTATLNVVQFDNKTAKLDVPTGTTYIAEDGSTKEAVSGTLPNDIKLDENGYATFIIDGEERKICIGTRADKANPKQAVLKNLSNSSLTVSAEDGLEYNLLDEDGNIVTPGTWSTAANGTITFDGLTAGKTYTVVARTPADENANTIPSVYVECPNSTYTVLTDDENTAKDTYEKAYADIESKLGDDTSDPTATLDEVEGVLDDYDACAEVVKGLEFVQEQYAKLIPAYKKLAVKDLEAAAETAKTNGADSDAIAAIVKDYTDKINAASGTNADETISEELARGKAALDLREYYDELITDAGLSGENEEQMYSVLTDYLDKISETESGKLTEVCDEAKAALKEQQEKETGKVAIDDKVTELKADLNDDVISALVTEAKDEIQALEKGDSETDSEFEARIQAIVDEFAEKAEIEQYKNEQQDYLDSETADDTQEIKDIIAAAKEEIDKVSNELDPSEAKAAIDEIVEKALSDAEEVRVKDEFLKWYEDTNGKFFQRGDGMSDEELTEAKAWIEGDSAKLPESMREKVAEKIADTEKAIELQEYLNANDEVISKSVEEVTADDESGVIAAIDEFKTLSDGAQGEDSAIAVCDELEEKLQEIYNDKAEALKGENPSDELVEIITGIQNEMSDTEIAAGENGTDLQAKLAELYEKAEFEATEQKEKDAGKTAIDDKVTKVKADLNDKVISSLVNEAKDEIQALEKGDSETDEEFEARVQAIVDEVSDKIEIEQYKNDKQKVLDSGTANATQEIKDIIAAAKKEIDAVDSGLTPSEAKAKIDKIVAKAQSDVAAQTAKDNATNEIDRFVAEEGITATDERIAKLIADSKTGIQGLTQSSSESDEAFAARVAEYLDDVKNKLLAYEFRHDHPVTEKSNEELTEGDISALKQAEEDYGNLSGSVKAAVDELYKPAYSDFTSLINTKNAAAEFNARKAEIIAELEGEMRADDGELVTNVINEQIAIIEGITFGEGEKTEEEITAKNEELEAARENALTEISLAREKQQVIDQLDEKLQELLDSGKYSEEGKEKLQEIFADAKDSVEGATADDDGWTDLLDTEKQDALSDYAGVNVVAVVAGDVNPNDYSASEYSSDHDFDNDGLWGSVENTNGMGSSITLVIKKVGDDENVNETISSAFTSGNTIVAEGTSMTSEEVAAALTDKELKVTMDAYLMMDGKVVENFDGTYTVRVLLPESLRGVNGLQVVYLTDDGKVEVFATSVEGNYIVFTTAHFSEFLIIGEKNVNILWIAILEGVILLAEIIAFFIIRNKKKQKTDGKAAGSVAACFGVPTLLTVYLPNGIIPIIIVLAVLIAAATALLVYFVLKKQKNQPEEGDESAPKEKSEEVGTVEETKE